MNRLPHLTVGLSRDLLEAHWAFAGKEMTGKDLSAAIAKRVVDILFDYGVVLTDEEIVIGELVTLDLKVPVVSAHIELEPIAQTWLQAGDTPDRERSDDARLTTEEAITADLKRSVQRVVRGRAHGAELPVPEVDTKVIFVTNLPSA